MAKDKELVFVSGRQSLRTTSDHIEDFAYKSGVSVGDMVKVASDGTLSLASGSEVPLGAVFETDASDGTRVITHGVIENVLSSATPGTLYYLSTSGSSGSTLTTSPSNVNPPYSNTLVGFAKSASDLFVRITTSAFNSVYHTGDTDTYILCDDDTMYLAAGGRTFLKLEEASQDKLIINHGGLDVDLKVGGENEPNLIRTDAANDNVGIGTGSPECKLHVAGGFAAAGPSKTFVTFGSTDATPSVATGNLFKTGGSVQFTNFDDGVAGQIITIIAEHMVYFDVTDTNLKGGSTNITCASGDVTTWVFDGTNWYLMNFMDQSANLSAGH